MDPIIVSFIAIPIAVYGLGHIVYSIVLKKKIEASIEEIQKEIVPVIKREITAFSNNNNEFLSSVQEHATTLEAQDALELIKDTNIKFNENMMTGLNIIEKSFESYSHLFTGVYWFSLGVGLGIALSYILIKYERN